MSDSCFAPWCGLNGKYANPGVCNAPGGHAYKAPTSRTDEAPHLDEPNGAEGGIPSEAGKPAGPASPKPGVLGHHPNGADEEALAPYRAMSRDELELRAFAAEGRISAVAETVQHWRGSEERTASQGYIAPFRYSLAELAVTIRNAIFWANWPATEHLDVFEEVSTS